MIGAVMRPFALALAAFTLTGLVLLGILPPGTI
jgi:hypothetical protein